MDNFEAIVVGAAAAAIGTIIAFKFLNRAPEGLGEPRRPALPSYGARAGMLYVQDLPMTGDTAAPIVQANAITEAAFNQQNVKYAPAFGPTENIPQQEGLLTI